LDVDDAKVDESEGWGEIDWLNPEAAKDYLIMPARIRRLEQDVNDVKEGMRLFSEGMMQHMKLIQELRVVVKTLEKVIENIGGKEFKSHSV